MKKTSAFLLCVCMLLMALSPSHASENRGDADYFMRFAIFPTGTTGESYYFVLNRDGVLRCDFGIRKGDDIEQPDFLETTEASSEKKLNDSDLQTIIDLANKLEASGYAKEKQFWTDSWDVAFLYNGKVYEMNYWYNDDSGEFKDLINTIIELSPLPVDLRHWA